MEGSDRRTHSRYRVGSLSQTPVTTPSTGVLTIFVQKSDYYGNVKFETCKVWNLYLYSTTSRVDPSTSMGRSEGRDL